VGNWVQIPVSASEYMLLILSLAHIGVTSHRFRRLVKKDSKAPPPGFYEKV